MVQNVPTHLPPRDTGISRQTLCTSFGVLVNKSCLEGQRKSYPGAKAMKHGPVEPRRAWPQPQPFPGQSQGLSLHPWSRPQPR